MYCDATGKLVYLNRREATHIRSSVTRRRGQVQRTLNVYKCEFCGRFHLGRPPLKKKRRP